MDRLRDVREVEEVCAVVDIFASEYGWTIEEIQNLTLPEISCLLRCVLKRHGVKQDDLPSANDKEEQTKLLKLAKTLGAKPEELTQLSSGKNVKI